MAKVEVNLDRASETNKINVTSREIKEGNSIESNYNFDIPIYFDTSNAYVKKEQGVALTIQIPMRPR